MSRSQATLMRPPQRDVPARTEAIESRVPEVLLTAVFLLFTVPVILLQHAGPAGAKDQELFHLPTIRIFAEQFPAVQLNDARVATGPLFHVVMAPIERYVTGDRLLLQLIAMVFSVACVLVMFRVVTHWVGRWMALAIVLPFALSNYVVQSAAWLNTDNMALIFVILTLAASLAIMTRHGGFVIAGVAALLAVWVRQVDLFLAGVVMLAGILAAAVQPPGTAVLRFPRELSASARRTILGATGATALTVVGSLALFVAWGGLTPEFFRHQSGFSPSAWPFTLALLGLFGTPYLLATGASLGDIVRPLYTDARVAAATLLLVVIGSIVPLATGDAAGGGLWRVLHTAPTIAERSPLLGLLAGWGVLGTFAWWRIHVRNGRARESLLLLVALLGLTLANTVNQAVYQRYFEPQLLVLLAFLTAIALRDLYGPARDGPPPRRAILALGALTAVQVLGCIVVVFGPTWNAASLGG